MFRSQGDRGQCTTCGYVFLASEEFGMPSDTTLERELEVSSTESARILALELEPLSHMPDVEAPKHPDDRDEFQFFKDRLESARIGVERWRSTVQICGRRITPSSRRIDRCDCRSRCCVIGNRASTLGLTVAQHGFYAEAFSRINKGTF